MKTLKKEFKDNELMRITDFSIDIKDRRLIDKWNFVIKRGEVIVIAGHNGSGKTTLIRTISGLLKNYTGDLKIKKGTKISYMPQISSVNQNIPITVEDFINLQILEHNSLMLDELNINKIIKQPLKSVSGGELQKIIFYTTINSNADLVLLDEPENHLDPIASKKITDIISKQKNKGIVIVSHGNERILNIASHALEVVGSIFCRKHINCEKI